MQDHPKKFIKYSLFLMEDLLTSQAAKAELRKCKMSAMLKPWVQGGQSRGAQAQLVTLARNCIK